MKIGVLALQGAFAEHIAILKSLGAETCKVRLPEHLEGLSGLILPGGESTTFSKLAVDYELVEPLRRFAESKPMWGTCGGLVFLARETDYNQTVLGVMDIIVKRNAFGRQVDSFETDLDVKGLSGGTFRAVFIRAPLVSETGPSVDILCTLESGQIVGVKQGLLMGTSFHPELTDDPRIHKMFLELAESV